MGSLDGLTIRKLLKRTQIVNRGTDGPVAIRIRNKAGNAVTSVTVTTATDIVLIDSAGTTTSTFATDTTLSAVVNRINASASWEAKLLDALSTQGSVSTLLTGAITVSQDGNSTAVYDVKQDTSTALEIGVCLSPFRDFDSPRGRRVGLKRLKYGVNMGTAAVDSVQIFKRKGGGSEIKLAGLLSIDTTETTVYDFTAGDFAIYGQSDEELFIRVKDATTLADATSNYVEVLGEIE
ncbi:MAG: hypothetical protein SGJ02_11685 [bacterium]|nr:hypothetical protein [bacterium]